jgi:hypothetical protein
LPRNTGATSFCSNSCAIAAFGASTRPAAWLSFSALCKVATNEALFESRSQPLSIAAPAAATAPRSNCRRSRPVARMRV